MMNLNYLVDYILYQIFSFIVYIKTDDICKDVAEDVEHDNICWINSRTYSYLINDGSEDKKSKSNKKLCHQKKT